MSLLIINGGMAGYQYFTFTSHVQDMSDASQQMGEHSIALLSDDLAASAQTSHGQTPAGDLSTAEHAARLEDEVNRRQKPSKTEQHKVEQAKAEQEQHATEQQVAKKVETVHKSEGHSQTQQVVSTQSGHEAKKQEPIAKHEAEVEVCYEAGVFSTRGAATRLEKKLIKRNIDVTIDRKIKREKLGYWVYLKPERSLALSRLKAEEIKLKGLTDVAVVTHSTPKWAISLGVFHYEKTAKERKIKAEALGLQPLMTSRYKTETQYRVQMKMKMGKEPSENDWKELLKGLKGIEIKPMECPSKGLH